MSVRTLCVAIVAIALVLATFSLALFDSSPSHITVTAAKKDLLNFEVISLDLLESAEIPAIAYRKDQHFLWPDLDTMSSKQYEEALKELSDRACGRAVVYALNRGHLLLDWHLASKGTGRGLAELIPTGHRAVTIDLSETGGVPPGYFVRPGDYVDIIGKGGLKPGKAILESVEVLGIDQRPERKSPNRPPLGGSLNNEEPEYDEPRLRSVTVLVKAEDVEALESHRTTGTLTLSFRNFEDRSSSTPSTENE